MILVERFTGHGGLGVFTYLLSVYYAASFLSEAGIPEYYESCYSLFKQENNESEKFAQCFKTSLIISFLITFYFFISSFLDMGLSDVTDNITGYVIIGLTIPLKNINQLFLARLYATGHFEEASKLRFYKQVPFIITLFILLLAGVPVSLLMAGFFVSELYFLICVLKSVSLGKLFKVKTSMLHTLRQASDFFFNEKVHDIILYADFFILGIFISAEKLGVYAETGIFIRFFLLITFALKPLIQNYFSDLFVASDSEHFQTSIFRISGIIFFINSVLCLFFLLHFNGILHFFFLTSGEETVAYKLFLFFLPGLLFFSLTIIFEAALSVSNRIHQLKNIILFIVVLNIGLNLYLVPYAGFYGAAFATMVSMCVYFLLMLRTINLGMMKSFGLTYMSACALLFILYKLLKLFSLPFFIEPLAVFSVYYLTGVFDYRIKSDSGKRI